MSKRAKRSMLSLRSMAVRGVVVTIHEREEGGILMREEVVQNLMMCEEEVGTQRL